MVRKRENNYDLLRIVSTIAVIMIHVSGMWFSTAVDDIAKNGLRIADIQSPFFICIYNSISRFAVPCFLMLSGAFILDNEHNSEYKRFYSKSFEKIGIHAMVFSLLYILYQIPFCFVGEDKGITSLLKNIITGTPMAHMWYMYMLVGIYAMVPVVLRFKDSITEKMFYKVAFVFLILASISRWTTENVRLSWDVGQSFEYLGYFLVGYSIRKMNREKRNNAKAVVLIGGGVIFEICAAGLEYNQMINGIAESDLKFTIVAPYSPLIVLASVLIFYGFTLLDIKRNMGKISEISFFIYLLHGGIWSFMYQTFHLLKGKHFITNLDGAMWIPVFTVIVFALSCVFSKVYIRLWNKLDKDKRITKRLSRMVHLQID